MSKVADDTETLRSAHSSRAGTDVDSLSRSSSRPTYQDRISNFGGSITGSLAYHLPSQQQRVFPEMSPLQTGFLPHLSHEIHEAINEVPYDKNQTRTGNSILPSSNPPIEIPGHLSSSNSPSKPIQRRSKTYDQLHSTPVLVIPPQSNSGYQKSSKSDRPPRPPRSPYGKMSTLFNRSRVHLKSLARGGSPASPTSSAISREDISLAADLTPSIDLTTMDAAFVPSIVKAAQAGLEGEVEHLIEQGSDIDQCDIQTGRNALLVAAHCGHKAVVELLIRNKAQIAVIDEWGSTALHLAASRGHCAVIELLLVRTDLVEAKTPDGKTALRVATDHGQIRAIDLLLKKNAKVNARDQKMMTILHAAAEKGDAEISHLLITNGADVEAKDGSMKTALHYACEKGNFDVIQLLLDHRADIESPGPAKKTPLICAAGAGMDQAVDVLLKRRAAIRAVDDTDMTALHWAAHNGHEEIVKVLCQKRGFLSMENKSGQTPLHLAALRCHFAVVELLLRKGAPINSQCNRGLTALHYACDADSLEIANLLLLAGANVEISNFEDRQRPIHIAAARNSSSLLDLLCGRKGMLDARDSLGDRPLCVASRYGQVDAVRKLLEMESPLYYPYENSTREDSPLCLAVKGGHFPVVSLLLERGASTLRKDETGWQPIRYAAYHGHLEVLQLLLFHGKIPELDATEINAIPETIGFAPGISDEKKVRVRLLFEQAFPHINPKRGIAEISHPSPVASQEPTTQGSETRPVYSRHVNNSYNHLELPVGGPADRRVELPGYQIVSRGQKVHPFVLPGFQVISQEQQEHLAGRRVPGNRNYHQGNLEGGQLYQRTVPHGIHNSAYLSPNHDIPNESQTWPGPQRRETHEQQSSECSTWPRFPAPRQIAPHIHMSDTGDNQGHYYTMPRDSDLVAQALSMHGRQDSHTRLGPRATNHHVQGNHAQTREEPQTWSGPRTNNHMKGDYAQKSDESHTWPGPRINNSRAQWGHAQAREESSESRTWSQLPERHESIPSTHRSVSAATKSTSKSSHKGIRYTLVDEPNYRNRGIQLKTPLRSRIPRPRPPSQEKENFYFLPIPHLDPDSGSESDSSVHTAPESPTDPETYISLNSRNMIHELE